MQSAVASVFYRCSCLASRRFCLLSRGNLYLGLPLPNFLPKETEQDIQRIIQLNKQVEEARKPTARSLYLKPGKRVQRLDNDGNLRCTKCGQFKSPESFSIERRALCGRRSSCGDCSALVKRIYDATLRGVIKKILYSAKNSATKRSRNPIRELAGRYELSFDLLLNLWWEQQGRCAYSGIVLNIESYTMWQLSLERRNNKLGYVAENIVFVCAEFNTTDCSVYRKYKTAGSSRWSKEKVHLLPRLISASVPLVASELQDITLPVTPVKQSRVKRHLTSNGDLFCSKCSEFKAFINFSVNSSGLAGRSSVCKACKTLYTYSFSNFMTSRLHAAKLSAQKRASKSRLEAGVFRLTLEDVVDVYRRQQGLCYYSGIRMVPQPGNEWMCSVERLDNSQGYIRSNVALICLEFQTSDRSSRAKSQVVKGSSQWSKEKIAMLLQWLS